MQPLRESNSLVGNSRAIRELLDAQGYAFFRDVLDMSVVRHVYRGVVAWLAGHGVVDVVDGAPRYAGADVPSIVGNYPSRLEETELVEWFALHPEARRLYAEVLGEPGYVLQNVEYQCTWPGKPDCWERVHQDGPFMPGLEFVVFWVPLMEISEEMGGLAIVPTPQTTGSLHPPAGADALSPFIPVETFSVDAWHRADYRPGDVLVFAPMTPHCGMPNTSDRVRLSIDVRVQPLSAKRPVAGVLVDADPDLVVIAADSGEEVTLVLTEDTAVWSASYTDGRLDPKSVIGRRVLATEQDGRALVVRTPWGHIPWMQ
jgi:hypothetical protein